MPARSGASSSSMHTAASFSSSWIGSSPSRNSPSRSSPNRNGVRTPGRDGPRRATLDKESPSRQLLLEFSQMLIRSDEDFNNRLDQVAAQNAKLYSEQLNKAALEHERVRKGAEIECQRLLLEQELERRKREEEQQRELERVQQAKAKQEADARQRQTEAKQREAEAARRAAEQQRLIQEAEARLKNQKDQEEAARRQRIQQEEADRRAKEAAAAAEKARAQTTQQTSQASQPPPTSTVPTIPAPSAAQQTSGAADVEALHAKFIQLHKRMKDFWKPFKTVCAGKGHPLKEPVGDLRRAMRKATGQITVRREDSKNTINKLRGFIREARNAGGPTIDIRPFIISYPIPQLSNESEAQYPAMLLYAFICFEKLVIRQFAQEAASDDGKIIQELGAIVGSLFVDKEFAWKGIPLTDLLVAKFHRACPMLFGISGDMSTPQGQQRLGWMPVIGGYDITANGYNQRMQGLGAAWAAISLRAVNQPAIPISEYWRAIVSICNTPPQRLYDGHFKALQGLIRDAHLKFVAFYGAQAKAVLRKATFVLPRRAPERITAAGLVSVMPIAWEAQGFSLK